MIAYERLKVAEFSSSNLAQPTGIMEPKAISHWPEVCFQLDRLPTALPRSLSLLFLKSWVQRGSG